MIRHLRYTPYTLLLSVILFGLLLTGCGSNSSSTSPNFYSSSSSNSSYSSSSSSATRRPTYYITYVGEVEWILVPPQSIRSNQTYWIEFPAALLYYHILGRWELVRTNIIAYVPQFRLDNQSNPNYNSNYIGPQKVTYAKAEAAVAQQNESVGIGWDTRAQDQSVSDALDYGVPVDSSGATDLSSDGN